MASSSPMTRGRQREPSRIRPRPKGQMLKRASDPKGLIWCEGCGLNITGKAVEFDHDIPEAMVIDNPRRRRSMAVRRPGVITATAPPAARPLRTWRTSPRPSDARPTTSASGRRSNPLASGSSALSVGRLVNWQSPYPPGGSHEWHEPIISPAMGAYHSIGGGAIWLR
jgi:hypothetical protein